MTALKNIFLTLVCYLITMLFAYGQHAILDNMTITQNNNQVFVKMIISGGQTCQGIKIYRDQDSTLQTLIGNIPGVCGSASSAVPYEYIDESPIKNQLVYYRAEMCNQGFTTALPFTFLDFGEGLLLYPNPATDRIVFNIDTENKNRPVTIYNALGIPVLDFITASNQIEIDISGLEKGMYYVQVHLETNKISQSFLKL